MVVTIFKYFDIWYHYMDLIKIINNILQPHFYLVDNPYSDIHITNFEELIGNKRLFWKLNGKINLIKQKELLEMVKQLNFGKTELCSLSSLGKYLVFEQI